MRPQVQGNFRFGARRQPCAPQFVDRQLEAQLLRECSDLLTRRGIAHWRLSNGGARVRNAAGPERFVQFGIKGGADILAILRPCGRWLAIECKAPGREPSDDQADFLDAINAAGGIGIVVYDVAELDAALTAARLEGAGQRLETTFAETSESVGPVKSRNEDGSPSISELPARSRGRSWRSTRSADSLVPATSNLETTTRKTRRPATC